MNRAARRAFAKNIAKAMGRAKAHRPPRDEGPTLEERLAKLEAEKAQLEQRIAALDDGYDKVPGVSEHRLDWFVHVGGERVDVKALPAAEWIRTLETLPEFLFAFAMEKIAQPKDELSDKSAQDVTDLAKRWLVACAVKPEDLELDRLTLLEAQHAVAHIARLNGVTAYMRAWFRKRLARVAAAAPGSAELRDAPERPAGDQPN